MLAQMGGKVLKLREIEEWEAEQRGLELGIVRGMERGLKRGMESEREEGISALVELCQEFGMILVDTIERFCNAYGITEPES